MSSKIETVTDEMLSAYIDDELDPGTRQALEALIRSDPGLRAEVERLRQADALVQAAFDRVGKDPVPLALLRAAQPAKSRSRHVGRPVHAPVRYWQVPLAASIALAVGLAVGASFMAPKSGDAQRALAAFAKPLDKDSALYHVLESTPSDSAYRTADGNIAPVLTFQSTDGRYCREFEWRTGGRTLVGLACRTDPGVWSAEAAINVASRTEDGAYRPAGDEEQDMLASVRTRLMSGTALDVETEEQLIARGWPGDAIR